MNTKSPLCRLLQRLLHHIGHMLKSLIRLLLRFLRLELLTAAFIKTPVLNFAFIFVEPFLTRIAFTKNILQYIIVKFLITLL